MDGSMRDFHLKGHGKIKINIVTVIDIIRLTRTML